LNIETVYLELLVKRFSNRSQPCDGLEAFTKNGPSRS
jgi:hypothetical protein